MSCKSLFQSAIPLYLIFIAFANPTLGVAQTSSSTTIPWVRHISTNHGVIVFVHGVLGDERSTWTSAGDHYWPSMLTGDRTFDGQNIYVYRYPSPRFQRSFSIDEVAENMRLVLETDGVLRQDAITFVCHSMGGVVTRAFIVKYQRELAGKIRFLYFFATPTTGSPYAKLASLMSRNRQFKQLYPMDSDNYLGTLQSNWLAANLQLRSFCAYETLPLYGQIIVERQSATNLCTERLDPIDADHISIVKPEDQSGTAYRALKAAFLTTSQPPIAPSRAGPKTACRISVTATSEAVARIYSRGLAPTTGQATYRPYVQELFYDWILTLHASLTTKDVTIVVHDTVPLTDRVRVTPEVADVSESIPKWMSGFTEPRPPDYYVRTIHLQQIRKSDGAIVVFRRPIKLIDQLSSLSESNFNRSFEVFTNQCGIETHQFDVHEQAIKIFRHLGILGMWRYSGQDQPPLQTKRDPDVPNPPLAPTDVEATLEARCQNDQCDRLLMRQMEVRRGGTIP